FDHEQRFEDVFEVRELRAESRQRTSRGSRLLLSAFVHPSGDLFLRLEWRQIRNREEVFAFKVCTFRHEMRAALIIDDPCYSVGKCAGRWILRRFCPNRIAMNHPAAA